jgi:PAS domain S-box-containing protein
MNKLISFLILSLMLLLAENIKAQSIKVDSLEMLLKLHKPGDTIRVNLLNETASALFFNEKEKILKYATQANELADKLNFRRGKMESLLLTGTVYKTSNPLLTLDYSQKALRISKEINDKQGIVKSLNLEGSAYNALGKYDQAHESFKTALKISEDLNDRSLIAKCYTNISASYWLESNYSKSNENLQKAIAIAEKLGDKAQMASCFHLLGIIVDYQGNNSLALEYQQKSLAIYDELNDKYNATSCYISIGIIYFEQNEYRKSLEHYQSALKIALEMKDKKLTAVCYINIGEVYKKQKDHQAFGYYENALKISKEISNKSMVVNTLHNIGDLYSAQDNYDKALEYYQNSFKVAKEINNNRNISSLESKIGLIYFKQKNYAAALNHSLTSLELAKRINLLPVQKDIHLQLAEIYAATNDNKNAYIHHKLFKQLDDSIFNEKNIKKIAELEYSYKFEKEKQAIELEQQKKDAIYKVKKQQQEIIVVSLTVCFILMSLLAVFQYRSSRFKQKTNVQLTRQKNEIEELNVEYKALNEELTLTNEQLYATKEMVEKSEEKLRKIIEQISDALVIFDKEGKIVIWNSGAEKITSLSVNETLNRKFADIQYQLAPSHLKDKNEIEKTIAGIVNFVTPDLFNRFVDEEIILPDNTTRSIQSIYFPIDLGTHFFFGVVFRDITEKKYIEKQLEEYNETKQKLLSMELNRINQELETNQKSMTAATLKLIQNSERDSKTIEQLMEVEKNTNPEGKQKINALIADYKRLSYTSNWDEFEILFEKVHQTFYEKLNSLFPNLTVNERKICAFLKLNMSSKDIAQITFQSEEALKKARLRLRQKLGIERETNMTSFLQNI